MALAAVVSIASQVGGLIGSITKKSSASRAEAVLGSVVNSALVGNLTAVRCLDERQTTPTSTPIIGIASERAVWARGFQQVVTTKPELLTQYNTNRSKIPAIDNSGPEAAAASALAHPFSVSGTSGAVALPGLTTASQVAVATGLPLWVLLVLGGGAAWLVYKAVKKG